MNMLKRVGIGVVAAAAASAVMAAPALANPANATKAVILTATCNGVPTTLVHNAGDGQGQGTMNNPKGQAVFSPAFVLGTNEVIVTTAVDLTITGPGFSFHQVDSKNQSFSVECDNVFASIPTPQGTITVSGTAWGNIH